MLLQPNKPIYALVWLPTILSVYAVVKSIASCIAMDLPAILEVAKAMDAHGSHPSFELDIFEN